jgi:hypothetical protein
MGGASRFYYELAVHPDTQDVGVLEAAYGSLPKLPEFNPALDLDVYVAAELIQHPNRIVVPILIDESGFELDFKPELDPRLAHLGFDYELWEILVHDIELRFARAKSPNCCISTAAPCLKLGACFLSMLPWTWLTWDGIDAAGQKQNRTTRRCLTWCLDDSAKRLRTVRDEELPESIARMFPQAKSVGIKGFRSSHQPPMRALLRHNEGTHFGEVHEHPIQPKSGRKFHAYYRCYAVIVIEYDELPPPIQPKHWQAEWKAYYDKKKEERKLAVAQARISRVSQPLTDGAGSKDDGETSAVIKSSAVSAVVVDGQPDPGKTTTMVSHRSMTAHPSMSSHRSVITSPSTGAMPRPLLKNVSILVATRGPPLPDPGAAEDMNRAEAVLVTTVEDGDTPKFRSAPRRRNSRSDECEMCCIPLISCCFCLEVCDDCCLDLG